MTPLARHKKTSRMADARGASMASPREQIIPDQFRLTDQDLYGILTEDDYLDEQDEWVDYVEEEVTTTEHIELQQEQTLESASMPGNATISIRFPFTGNPGIKGAMPGTQPVDYFNLLMNIDFYNLLLTCTSINGELLQRNATGPHARFKRWKATTIEELKVFIGLILLMGVIRLNGMTEIKWNDRLLEQTLFVRFKFW